MEGQREERPENVLAKPGSGVQHCKNTASPGSCAPLLPVELQGFATLLETFLFLRSGQGTYLNIDEKVKKLFTQHASSPPPPPPPSYAEFDNKDTITIGDTNNKKKTCARADTNKYSVVDDDRFDEW